VVVVDLRPAQENLEALTRPEHAARHAEERAAVQSDSDAGSADS
jgi:hypothetical protein